MSDFIANPDELAFDLGDEDMELGRVLSGRARKRLKKAVFHPIIIAHKITHGKKSPIRKAELALQKGIGKALPFTKPFIDTHNKVSGATYKAMEKTGLTKKGSTLLADTKKASPQVAAAQMAAGAALKGNVNAGLSSANAEALNLDAAFRNETLSTLLSKSEGGNQSATFALDSLRR